MIGKGRKWWVSLPLATLLSILLAIWEGTKGRAAQAIILAAVAVVFIALSIQRLFATPSERKALTLLRFDLQQRVRRNRFAVLREFDKSTYIFVEDAGETGIATLWFFGGDVMELMENENLEKVYIPSHGVRIKLYSLEIWQCQGLAILYRNNDGTFAITPPDPGKYGWEQRGESAENAGQRELLQKFKTAIRQAERRGRRLHFRR